MLEDITKKESVYTILEALEAEGKNGVATEEKILTDLFEELEEIENGETMRHNIEVGYFDEALNLYSSLLHKAKRVHYSKKQ